MPWSQIVGLVLSPDTILFLALAICLLGWAFGNHVFRRAAGLLMALIILLLFLPIGALLLRPLESRFQPGDLSQPLAGIVLLCGAEQSGLSQAHGFPHVDGSAERMMYAAALAREHPEAKVIVTGGSYFADQPSQATIAAQFLRLMGVDDSRLIIETESKSTYENATMSIIQAEPLAGSWALVTSAYHMPRAMGAFRSAGWTGLLPAPTDYRSKGVDLPFLSHRTNIVHIYLAAHEWMGLAYYRLHGRTANFFPGQSSH